jgi:hypothetical protein
VIIFYCLKFEASLYLASYDSQGHGGGIRSGLHTADEAEVQNVAKARKHAYLYILGTDLKENPFATVHCGRCIDEPLPSDGSLVNLPSLFISVEHPS